jgi:hypothetical protein
LPPGVFRNYIEADLVRTRGDRGVYLAGAPRYKIDRVIATTPEQYRIRLNRYAFNRDEIARFLKLKQIG